MHDAYLEKLEKLDKCIEENMEMITSRNAEFVEKLFDIRHKAYKMYRSKDETSMHSKDVSDLALVGDSEMIMIEKLIAYKKAKTDKKTGVDELKCFMDELFCEFEIISDLSEGCDDERNEIKHKIKEIFSLFN